ncbi:Potassium transporter [Melia azedarach]|uniref:Potassium transporter n=1 Tax=Melia azedarach TaxID=155640 RepID=A0ACC1YYG3_MELAZ|nr:Potassium transporter [Melia azedarach]
MSGEAVKDPAKESQEVVVKWYLIFQLAFQSIGIVYGDIGTSPLYVYSSTFTNGINHEDDILGVLSLVFYTLTLIPLLKYVFIVLHANDNGGGGTFALYSLICRYAKVGFIPSKQAEECNVSGFQDDLPGKFPRTEMASRLKYELENSQFAKLFLLMTAMLGPSLLIGDGVLTPCVSVLSAVGGIKEATSAMTEGSEALFEDVGHFSVRSIQISMCTVTYPALVLAYTKASFLHKHTHLVKDTFFKSIPGPLCWPVFVVAVLAAIHSKSSHYFRDILYNPTIPFIRIMADTKVYRIPGLAIFFSELIQGIPPIFKDYVANVPALPSLLVFVSIKSLQISKVPMAKRFIFCREEPKCLHTKELNVFPCVMRYGYKDMCNESEPFERMLVEKLGEFVREDYLLSQTMIINQEDIPDVLVEAENGHENPKLVNEETQKEAMERDKTEIVDHAWRAGVVHLIGERGVIAGNEAGIGKRILIDYAYNFLNKNLRQNDRVLDIPHKRILKVGMHASFRISHEGCEMHLG